VSKPKGPTWEQVGLANLGMIERKVETKEYAVITYDVRANGHTSVLMRCPFCQSTVEARTWSLAGGGKRCGCGAIMGSAGTAHHWADR